MRLPPPLAVELFPFLIRTLGSRPKAKKALDTTAELLGQTADATNQTLVALTLCTAGVPLEQVSRSLDWKQFESFCSGVFEASGCRVEKNVSLKKPRAQIDFVAF